MISTTQARCLYIGDARDSHFVRNNIYQLEIINGFFGRISVVPLHGYEHRPMREFAAQYRSLHHFLHDWHIEDLIHNYYSGSPMEQ